jgi:outer membrane protein OmpA-like peptidoglycan-associated protein
MKSFVRSGAIIFAIALMASCSSEPKVSDFQSNADPQVELEHLNSNLEQARAHQVDVLAPENYKLALQSRDQAVNDRASDHDQKPVLHSIALAQAYLDIANRNADTAIGILKTPVEARQDAIAANAMNFEKDKMIANDHLLMRVTHRIEEGNTADAASMSVAIEASYRNIEMRSIQQEHLGAAEKEVDEAKNEGAKKLTPDTLKWAELQMQNSRAVISANPHDASAISRAQSYAETASARLLKMVRDAKGSKAQNPEQLAERTELNEKSVEQSWADLNHATVALADRDNQLASASAQNDKLQSQVWLDREYDSARRQFSSDEADVYKQGDKLLLRLKGLSFASNKAQISVTSYAILSKVQKIIADIGPSQVMIEGHTESLGGKVRND